jgi:hypothetical protein
VDDGNRVSARLPESLTLAAREDFGLNSLRKQGMRKPFLVVNVISLIEPGQRIATTRPRVLTMVVVQRVDSP